MKPEEFDSQNYLPEGYYPFPNLINPHVQRIDAEMDNLYDTAYGYLTEKQRAKYKKWVCIYVQPVWLPQPVMKN
jgi:hypothetical protein